MRRSGRRAWRRRWTPALPGGAVVIAVGMVALATGAVMAQDASPAASPGGTPSWSPAPPDAVIEVARDTFESRGPWWTGSDEVGSSSVADGVMRWTIAQDGRSIWDTPDLPAQLDEVRVEANVLVEEGIGAGGPVCAGPDTGELAIWAGVSRDEEWLVGRIVGSRMQVITRGDLKRVLDEDDWIGAPRPLLVTLECTVAAEGDDHYTLWVQGIQVADVVDEPVGPFLHAGLMATADEAGLAVVFDDFAVFAGTEEAPSPSLPPEA